MVGEFYRLKRLTEAAGITRHVSFHCARHTFISRLAETGVDIKTISILAGHSSTRHTERYLHISVGHLRACVQRICM